MKKIITGIFAIAAFTFSAVAQKPATDQKDKMERRGMRGGGMEGMAKLNLTESQKQQMKTIDMDFRTRMQALHQNDNILVKDMKAQQESLMKDRQNKINAILTPEQRTQFELLRKEHEGQMGGKRDGKFGDRERGPQGKGDRLGSLQSQLGLTDDQAAKIKAGNESFKARAKAIQENSSLSADQKRSQFEALQKDREANMKSFLTPDQIAKLDQMKGKHGDFKNKEKKKGEVGKEKIKTKNI